MSIINDALKKAEKIREGGPVQGSARKEKVKAKEKVALIVVTACGILLMLFAAVILLKGGPPLSYAPMPAKDGGAALGPGQGPVANADPEELVLTGIVYGEKMPMAVINGSVYIEGDIVKKAKIIKISEDKVTLDRKGRIVELVVR